MGEPLSPDLTYETPTVVSALNTCRTVEVDLMRQCGGENIKAVNVELERHLVYVRILGYLLIHGPSTTAQTWVAKCIHSCKDRDELLDLGRFFDQHLLASFGKHEEDEDIPIPSHAASRPSYNRLEDLSKAKLVKSPQSHTEANYSALLRDSFRCVISGCIDQRSYMEHRELIPNAHNNILATQCCHIISEPTNQHGVIRIGDKVEHAANVWTIFHYFGYPEMRDDLAGPKIHSMTNIITLEYSLRDLFDTLNLWLEETNIPNRYNVNFVPSISDIIKGRGIPEAVELTSMDPGLALPSPVYLRLHAACCKVAHLSGAAQYHDRIERETEDFEPMLATEEEFSTLLEARLHDLGSGQLGMGVGT